jgi:hypothetical protein
MSGFSFDWPFALWGLALVPVLVVALRRSRAVLSLRVPVTLTRVLALVLVVLAMADARLHWPTDRLAVAVVLDRSESIAAQERDAWSQRLRQLMDREEDPAWVDLTTPVPGQGLGDQIASAAALLPTDRVRRVLVATDGRAPGIAPVIESAARAGVSVWSIPMGGSPHADQLSVVSASVPRLVRAGETVTIDVQVFSLEAQRMTLKLSIDGQVVSEEGVDVPAGEITVRRELIFPDEGVRRLEIQAIPARDTLAGNNVWTSLVRVVPPARVLLIRPAPPPPLPPLATVLEEARLQVDVVTPADAPRSADELERYQLVVVDEVVPDQLQDAQQQAIRSWVEDAGGGLITVTGANGVRREPATFREIEPIQPPRAIPESPPLELILVIDRSSSMSGRRLEMARLAAVEAVRALRADSRVGVVAFSGAADQVIAPMDMTHRDWIIGFLSSIGSGGGTDIAAALQAAQTIVSPDPAVTHHVILLSDGISSSGPAVGEAQVLAWRGVSISTISLGGSNSLMADIARIGGGRHHAARDPSELPRLFAREAQYRQPPPFVEEETRPRVAEPMDFLEGVDFDTDPPLEGYVIAEPREGAETALVSPEGDPLLALWYVGAGRVMSFTSATAGPWADQWRTGPGFRTLWSQAAWEMLRPRDQQQLQIRLDPHPLDVGTRLVTVTTADLGSEDAPEVVVSRGPNDVKPLPLTRRGPALWQGETAVNDGFIVWGSPPGEDEPVAAVGEDRPYDIDELSRFGPDLTSLETWVALGNGSLVRDPRDVLVRSDRVTTMVALRLPILALALISYLASVLLQRLPRNVRSAVTTPARKDTTSRESNGQTGHAARRAA